MTIPISSPTPEEIAKVKKMFDEANVPLDGRFIPQELLLIYSELLSSRIKELEDESPNRR